MKYSKISQIAWIHCEQANFGSKKTLIGSNALHLNTTVNSSQTCHHSLTFVNTQDSEQGVSPATTCELLIETVQYSLVLHMASRCIITLVEMSNVFPASKLPTPLLSCEY